VSFVGMLQSIQDTEFSTSLRESVYMWGIVDGVHVIGLCLFLGTLLYWELRLFNRGIRGATVSETWDRLSPLIFAGFVVMIASGSLLFVSEPLRFWGSILFRIKMVAFAVAGVNAAAFHYTIGRRLVDWDTEPLPASAHVVGAISITLWLLVLFCGRLIAYNWFKPLI
jgi:hypothetical protein